MGSGEGEWWREEGKDVKHRGGVPPLFHDVDETRKIPDTLQQLLRQGKGEGEIDEEFTPEKLAEEKKKIQVQEAESENLRAELNAQAEAAASRVGPGPSPQPNWQTLDLRVALTNKDDWEEIRDGA